jgi:hypothetical protein
MLSALRRERAGREEIERLAREQAAVRRVATLVVKAAAPEEIFAAAGEELARLSRGGGTLSMRSRPGEGRLLAEPPARPGQPSAASRPGRRSLHPRQAGGA